MIERRRDRDQRKRSVTRTRHRPAGSGFYIVSLDATECKAEVAEAYGCKFDAKGNPTACGVAEVDDKNDDIIIATASK